MRSLPFSVAFPPLWRGKELWCSMVECFANAAGLMCHCVISSLEGSEFIRFLNSVPGNEKESSCRIWTLELSHARIASHLNGFVKAGHSSLGGVCSFHSFEEVLRVLRPHNCGLCIRMSFPGG